jgi:enoyl-CoA hydratase/carnithine racemase
MNAPESKVAVEPYVLEARDASGVVTLTMNRPQQFNALSVEMLTSLQGALDAISADPTARVVVLAGAGKAFCAGHDLKQMKDDPSLDTYRALFDQCAKLMLTLQRLPQPVIARVHGVATAAGCQLVATCDLAVAAEGARFGVSGINVGLFCTTPGVALARNVRRKEAFEMLVTGDLIDAQAARVRGLVNRVVPADRLDAEIAQLAASIVAKPAVAVSMGKAMFYRQVEAGIEAAYQMAGQSMACNLIDPAAQEGLDAFIAKRKPGWAPQS